MNRGHQQRGMEGAAVALGAIAVSLSPAHAQDWTTYGGSASRVSIAARAPASISAIRWTCTADMNGQAITFEGQAGVAATRSRVYAIGKSSGVWRLFGIDAGSGVVVWQSTISAPVADSWSSPTIDPINQTVLVASGQTLSAFDAASGLVKWSAPLTHAAVNATPLVTKDRGAANRALITDYDGFGSGARLYCFNVDPFDAALNPYQPGDLVWARPIGGSSGNTPAYASGVVYVASTGDGSGGAGWIYAYPISGTSETPPLWQFTNPNGAGFFGGVCVADTGSGTSVYGASYAFAGGQLAANLVKLDASTGDMLWSTPCNRTSSTPIPLPGGYIALSSGVVGFGSAPSIELFKDNTLGAALVWDTALATWNDANESESLDPGEYTPYGGWSTLGVAVPGSANGTGPTWSLLVGLIPNGSGTAGACTDLYQLDLSRAPTDSGFVAQHLAGAGSTPAISNDGVSAAMYTLGASGLVAVGGPACYANCDGSTVSPVLSASDFVCFLTRFRNGDAYANCDGSTISPVLSASDFVCFLSRFRGGCS